jgi:hypothetical protein
MLTFVALVPVEGRYPLSRRSLALSQCLQPLAAPFRVQVIESLTCGTHLHDHRDQQRGADRDDCRPKGIVLCQLAPHESAAYAAGRTQPNDPGGSRSGLLGVDASGLRCHSNMLSRAEYEQATINREIQNLDCGEGSR